MADATIPPFPKFPPDFDPDHTDKQYIEEGHMVPCRICLDVFRELNWTHRYCAKCEHGACQSRHLSFHRGAAFCILHGGKR